MRQLAAETWFPDLSAFWVFGRSRHRALAYLGGGGGLGVRDPRPRIGIVICPLFPFWRAGRHLDAQDRQNAHA